ncbi:Uncharacterised protein [Vibrio cholerae]|nr:Uncharacterised protein [Vibrio cholerae]
MPRAATPVATKYLIFPDLKSSSSWARMAWLRPL